MRRRCSSFVGFWYDFVVGDDWSVAVGVIAALALTYVLSDTRIPVWWVLPAAVVVVLPLSLWRVACRAVTSYQATNGRQPLSRTSPGPSRT